MKTVIRNSYTPKLGDYCETIVVDKETGTAYIFDQDGVWTELDQTDVDAILARATQYTDEQVAPLAEKLDTIEVGAQVNTIEKITQNGTELTITNKTVNVTVPTKTSDITNDGSDGTDTYVESATLDDYYTKDETDTQIGYETNAREIADSGLQEQIDAIVASSDVVDIVGTYAALQAYDTTKLHDNDIIKVLTDETRDGATTYYRWDADTSTWSYIGAEGPFYTKAESDAIFTPMTRTINSKALSSDITLTAADVGALPDSTVIPTVNDGTLTIQKNGTAVATFTANQAGNATANITVPTDTSDLTNDGDGQSPFATEDYVDTYGGKIDVIEVNGTAQPIVNKTVDISVPTKTSDLTNDGADGTSTYVETDELGAAAFSNDYTDLDNRPTIPTVNDAVLTIQKNGVDVATFTANSASAATANITVPTDTSDLTNGAGFITSSALANYYTKSETYSQGEVNSLINGLNIPTKTSDLINDSGFLTAVPIASAQDLGGVKVGSGLSIAADGTLSVTSAGSVAWNDITGKPSNVSYWTNDAGYITSADIPTNVSAFTNDAGYITSASIPTNVSAFTNDAGYLTAAGLSNYYTKSETYSQQEVNALISAISVPTKTSELTNDGSDGTSTYVEADDLATVATTGDYDDLTNAPTPPTDFTGATSSAAGTNGLVPAPAAGDQGKVLMGDGTWSTLPSPELVEMSYGESNAWAKFIAAYNAHCIVYCRASSNANPASGSQTRKAFMAYVNNETNPTQVEFQYYRSVSSHTDAQQGDQVFVYLLTNANGGTWSVTTRNTFTKIVAGTNMTSSYSSGTLTLNGATIDSALDVSSTNPVQNSVITAALNGKSGTATFYVGDTFFQDGGTGLPIFTDSAMTTQATLSDIYNEVAANKLVYIIQRLDISLQTVEINEVISADSPSQGSDIAVVHNNDLWTLTYASIPPAGWSLKKKAPNDGTLTIQHNGTTVQTFSANSSTNKTANIETIWADDIAPATQVPPITSSMIDWSTVEDIAPSDFITLNSGFSFYSSAASPHNWIKKFGNIIFATLVIEATDAFTTSNTVIGNISAAYRPHIVWNGDCVFGSAYAVGDTGYFYFNGDSGTTQGNVTVSTAGSSTYKYLKVKLFYFL